MAENWLREYEELNTLTNEIISSIRQYKQLTGIGSNVVSQKEKLLADIENKKKSLSMRLTMLEEDLNEMAKNPNTFKISKKEEAKRREDLTKLKGKLAQITTVEENLVRENKERNELLSGALHSSPFHDWDNQRNKSDSELAQLFKETEQTQNQRLSLIGESVAKQKQYAITINEETKSHLEILDRIDNKMNKSTDLVVRGSEQTERLNEKQSTCIYWVVIAILFIIILSLVVLNLRGFFM